MLIRKIIPVLCILLLLLPAARSQNAPVTTAGHITNAVPGNDYPIDLTVTGFTNVGDFFLTLTFDTTRLHYLSSTPNPALPGMTVTYTPATGNTQGKLVFSWSGASNVSLADGSPLANLTFKYMTGTGQLTWAYILGSVCRYKRWVLGTLTTIPDDPKYLYYKNGGISNRSAPVTHAPVIANPVPGPLPIPITVDGFTGIGALTLYLEYDPAIITFLNTFTKDPKFGGNFQVGSVAGEGGKMQIVIQWYGGAVDLGNGATMCTLNFSYPVATCSSMSLSWFDNGPSCEYADGPGDVLIDMPQSTYYINGSIGSGLTATSWTGNISSAWDNPGNWNCGLPGITSDVVIPNVAPNPFPVVNGSASCLSVVVETGATLTVAPAGVLTVGGQ